MNNSRPVIVLALILGAIAAIAQVFTVFFAGSNTTPGITADSISLLPEAINTDQLTAFTDRANKYLVLTPQQFEDGVDPTGLTPIPTPTVTPTP